MVNKRKYVVPILLLMVCLLGGIMLYTWFDPVKYAWIPKCPFHQFTGWNCPVCDMQRAMHALLHGRFVEAMSYNYFFVLTFPYIIAFFVAEIFKLLQRENLLVRVVEHPVVVKVYLVLCLVWWVLRNVFNV